MKKPGMSGRSPFTPTKGPERSQIYEGNFGGSLVQNKSSFSMSLGRRAAFEVWTWKRATIWWARKWSRKRG